MIPPDLREALVGSVIARPGQERYAQRVLRVGTTFRGAPSSYATTRGVHSNRINLIACDRLGEYYVLPEPVAYEVTLTGHGERWALQVAASSPAEAVATAAALPAVRGWDALESLTVTPAAHA